jgi:hypothetical protein
MTPHWRWPCSNGPTAVSACELSFVTHTRRSLPQNRPISHSSPKNSTNGGTGSSVITGHRAPGAAAACPSRTCSPRCAMTAARFSRRGEPGWRGGQRTGPFGTIRFDARWPRPWRSPSRPGGRRIPSPSATAGGSPDRLLRPDPVRHMSVISRSAERAAANRAGLRCRLERVADAGPVGSSRRSAQYKRTQHRSAGKAGRQVRTWRAYSRPARASGLQTAHSAWQCRQDKIPNHRADLVILRVVTGGRCWVRTNVG